MNERELQLFRNRLLDLSRQCEDRNVPTHSYFLTVEEQRFAAQCLPNVAGIRVISDLSRRTAGGRADLSGACTACTEVCGAARPPRFSRRVDGTRHTAGDARGSYGNGKQGTTGRASCRQSAHRARIDGSAAYPHRSAGNTAGGAQCRSSHRSSQRQCGFPPRRCSGRRSLESIPHAGQRSVFDGKGAAKRHGAQ